MALLLTVVLFVIMRSHSGIEGSDMKNRSYSWISTAVLVLVGLSIVLTGSAAAQSADIVVATDGSGDYTTIQAAIDNANQNNRIQVKSGTYSESFDIDKDLDIVAPNEATIAPPSSSVSAVAIDSGVEPHLENLTLRGDNRIGLDARSTTGDWTATNLEITGFDFGITTIDSEGNWVVTDTTIENVSSRGVSADNSAGSWTINSSTIRNVSGLGVDAYRIQDGVIKNTKIQNITKNEEDDGDGINLYDSSGNWKINNVDISDVERKGINAEETNGTYTPVIQRVTIEGTADHAIDFAYTKSDAQITDSTIRDTGDDAIEFKRASGDWKVKNVSIEQSDSHGLGALRQPASSTAIIRNLTVLDTKRHGVELYNTSGDFEIVDSHISNSGWSGIELSDSTGDWIVTNSTIENADDFLIGARRATGDWQINESKLATDGIAVNATAAVEGNASYNYWGAADGPSETFCGSGGAIGGYNVTMYPYYTDSSLTTLSSATTSGTVQIASSCVIPEDISESNEQELVLTLSQISADGQSDNITITMPEDVSVKNVGEPRAIGTPYEVDVTNSGDPIKLKINPDEPKATVDFVLRVPVELSSSGD